MRKTAILLSATVATLLFAPVVGSQLVAQENTEVVDKRNYSMRVFKKDGDLEWRAYSGDVNYKDPLTGEFRPIDRTLTKVFGGWEMTKHSYHSFFPEYADQTAIFFDRYKGKNVSVGYTAIASHVKGVLSTDTENPQFPVNGKGVKYADAFGAGIDLWYYNNGQKMYKVVSIPPHTSTIELEWKITFPEGYDIYNANGKSKGKKISFGGRERGALVLSSANGVNEEELTFLPPARVWGANGKSSIIDVEIDSVGSDIIYRKIIPPSTVHQWTDGTTTYNSGAGDGYVESVANSNYGVVNADTTGGANDEAGTSAFVDANQGATFYDDRARTIHDTNGITGTISACSLNLWILTVADGDNDANGVLLFGESTVVSDTALENSDIDEVLPAANWSTNLDLTGLGTGGYSAIPCNATGIANVNVSGKTDLAIVNGHSFANDPPDGDGTVTFSTSEQANQEPYLSVTTSVASSPVFFILSFIPRAFAYGSM